MKLGSTITAKVSVNGLVTNTLVDTASPVTIASLMFMMKALAQKQVYLKKVKRMETSCCLTLSYLVLRLGAMEEVA